MVRIQDDRGQHVIDTGPYSWVRHPGYSGAMITYIAVPFLLESLWAFIPVALAFIFLFMRTSLEDKALQEKLAGYQDYTRKVKYRLIPGIW
jgi:protein-S-isoprenylcysteine O-methyltransferase Ste14